jgi:hypothetical protein
MTGHGEKLTRKQDAAIAALLQKPTIEAAAAEVGVNEKTLRAWLKREGFQSAYRLARRQIVESAVNQLTSAAAEAVAALVAVLGRDESKDADAIRAAKTILQAAIHGVEVLDLEPRLRALEEAEASRKKRGETWTVHD